MNDLLLRAQVAEVFERQSAGPGSLSGKFLFTETEPGCDTLLYALRLSIIPASRTTGTMLHLFFQENEAKHV